MTRTRTRNQNHQSRLSINHYQGHPSAMLLKLHLVGRPRGVRLLEGIEADAVDVVEASQVTRMVRPEL